MVLALVAAIHPDSHTVAEDLGAIPLLAPVVKLAFVVLVSHPAFRSEAAPVQQSCPGDKQLVVDASSPTRALALQSRISG